MNGLMSTMMECGEHPGAGAPLLPESGCADVAQAQRNWQDVHHPIFCFLACLASRARGCGFPKADAAPLVASVA